MSVLPCDKNDALRTLIDEYAEFLKENAHKLGNHGLSETDFYNSGLFRGAIEKIRGQFSATMREKRDFATRVLNYMQDSKYISEWISAGDSNRHDYTVTMPTGKTCVIELKGCLDGNNTNIFERPPHAEEFIIWSVCTNPGADPRHNAWSGIHTRLSADIISRNQRVDGVVIWDMVCGSAGRICPKLTSGASNPNLIGPFLLPPPQHLRLSRDRSLRSQQSTPARAADRRRPNSFRLSWLFWRHPSRRQFRRLLRAAGRPRIIAYHTDNSK